MTPDVGTCTRYDPFQKGRIALVDNARRFAKGHRIRLTLRSDDNNGAPPIMGFRHQPVGMSTRVTVASSSRLKLSVLPGG